ncbi:MAG: hypothetical protein ACKV0T_00150 [Planctomycetales bacterium]
MAKDMTVAQLERILEKKRLRLDDLTHRRDVLQKKLEQVENQITSIGGDSRSSYKKRKGRRRKNAKTLIECLVEQLTGNKKGLTLKELASRIRESGYKTSSVDFENTIYQIIYNNQDKLAHDPKTKTYRLK